MSDDKIINLEEYKKDTSKPLKIKVNERGAGWTKSCGSGATAAAAFIIKNCESKTDLQSPITVEQEGGILEAHWNNSMSLRLVGPSEYDYDGVWNG